MTKTALLSVFVCKIQSLLRKLDKICVSSSVEKPDLLNFCETWLNDSNDSKHIDIPGYTEHGQHDRSHKRVCKGVCIYRSYREKTPFRKKSSLFLIFHKRKECLYPFLQLSSRHTTLTNNIHHSH